MMTEKTAQEGHIFVSYTREDEGFVRRLRESLKFQDLEPWVDTEELRGGDGLHEKIKTAIGTARAFILVLGKETMNSGWVQDETAYALSFKEKHPGFPVIPLMLEGVKPAALKLFLKKETKGIHIGPGGVQESMTAILAALGERPPEAVKPMLAPQTEPMEELLLELFEPAMVTAGDGSRKAWAKARMKYRKETGEEIISLRFLFTAPLGPIDKDDLRWYLERYHQWPSGVFKDRAAKIEKKLPEWGEMLYDAVFGQPCLQNILEAWNAGTGQTARRFTVYVDEEAGPAPNGEQGENRGAEAMEAASVLLTLPWELMAGGRRHKAYFFQGARPVQVRRTLPNREKLQAMTLEPPIRVLLVSPRPEDEAALFFDHRVSALPLVSALEELGDRAQLTILSPPTLPALEKELGKGLKAGTPYHVVHFDGHGGFIEDLGGALCFEDPEDSGKLENRRTDIVIADELASVLHDHRVPMVYLEACESAQTETDPTASVAAALLDRGVASVVAMSHSVLVETARRFVTEFYGELARGSRVGNAMLAGQRELKGNSFRGKVFGAGRLNMQDWFVPVLYQEKEDLQLLTAVPSDQAKEMVKKAGINRLGKVPKEPEQGFVGRSRELLALERMLERGPYAVIWGQGGEGKTSLAAELARWLLRTRRFERGIFVSVEDVYDVRTVVDRIGQQVAVKYSVAEYGDADLLDRPLAKIKKELREYRSLIVLDNMESILPPPDSGSGEQGAGVSRFEDEELDRFFQLCRILLDEGKTALLFTSREPLPEPFHRGDRRVRLNRLYRSDAVELVHAAMRVQGLEPKAEDTAEAQPEVEALVESVNCHARSLVLLAPYISQFGVRHATENLGRLMKELQKKLGNTKDETKKREMSLYASLELSLRRLPQEMRAKLKPLGLFQGGGHIVNIGEVLELAEEERNALVVLLLQLGLAEAMLYNFIRFHPALCPYLLEELRQDQTVHTAALTRWGKSMKQLCDFLYEQQFENAQLSATLTTLELPNLMRLLDHVRERGDAEATVDLSTRLEQLLRYLGRKQLLARVIEVRERAAGELPDWNHTRFISLRAKLEDFMDRGEFPRALREAQSLLEKCLQKGEASYPESAYDTAMAFKMLGEVLCNGGASRDALAPTEEAQKRFRTLAYQRDKVAKQMLATTLCQKGDCLRDLGCLEEAAKTYEEGIKLIEELDCLRHGAAMKAQLGTVRYLQKRYKDALNAHNEAREIFDKLGDLAMVAVAWHQMGMVHEGVSQFEKAEQAYRNALAIDVQQNNPVGEASTLNQLGLLYDEMNRIEDAVIFLRQAADKYVEINDMANEGRARNNLADKLIKLKRYEDAREEIHRAIDCRKSYSHTAQLWATWAILSDLETLEGNQTAASEARKQAMALFEAYRRDGGENHETGGRICGMVEQAMNAGQKKKIEKELAAIVNAPQLDSQDKLLISKLQALLSGNGEPGMEEDEGLYYRDAVELKLLMEKVKGKITNDK